MSLPIFFALYQVMGQAVDIVISDYLYAFICKHITQGISTDKTCSMAEALRKNERVFLAIENTIADGLAVNTVGVNTFHNLKGLVDKMVNNKQYLLLIYAYY